MIKTIEISQRLADLCAQCLSNSGYEMAEKELRALLAAPAVERQEPVYWEYRIVSKAGVLFEGQTCGGWMKCHEDVAKDMLTNRMKGDLAYEVRPLYTSPPAPVSVALDDKAEFMRAFPDADMRSDGSFIHGEDQNKCRGWQALACFDKVKEMNK